MLLSFNKEKEVFFARDLLDDFDTSIINLPISIEIKYFQGVAPCGLALQILGNDLEEIEKILNNNDMFITHIFTGGKHDTIYEKIR